MRDRYVAIGLLVFVSLLYYSITGGLSNTNDGSHYALTRAIVDEHRFQIDTYKEWTEPYDLAYTEGHYYSDRAPGPALLASAVYIVADVLPRPISLMTWSSWDPGNFRLAYVIMIPVFAGAGAVSILFLILRGNGLSMTASITGSLAYAFGSTAFKYGTVFFSHSMAALMIMAIIWLALRIVKQGRFSWKAGLALGFLSGYAILVEYSNALCVVLTGLYLIAMLRQKLVQGEGWWKSVVALVVSGSAWIAFLFWYNIVNFKNPLLGSYTYQVFFPLTHTVTSTFSGSIVKGLAMMLWEGQTEHYPFMNMGITLFMPVMLLGLFGVWAYFRRNAREAILVVGVFMAHLLLVSMHFAPSGGTADGRYLNPFLGLWFVPVAYCFESIYQRDDESVLKSVLQTAAYGLLFMSVYNMIAHILFSYTDEAMKFTFVGIRRQVTSLNNLEIIWQNLFRNWQNAPLILMIDALGLGIAFGVARLSGRLRRQDIPEDSSAPA